MIFSRRERRKLARDQKLNLDKITEITKKIESIVVDDKDLYLAVSNQYREEIEKDAK